MRIFSKFHDYYDTALGYGIDPTVVYNRKPVTHKWGSPMSAELCRQFPNIIDHLRHFFVPEYFNGKIGIVGLFAVMFCGKMFFGLKLEADYHSGPKWIKEIQYCYSANDVVSFFKKHRCKLKQKTKDRFGRYRCHQDFSIENFKNYFGKATEDKTTDFHFYADSPIVLIQNNCSHVNGTKIKLSPKLKAIQFYRIIDSFTAFQELSMFIGGVMGGKVPAIVEISDKDRIAKHGFNEWSFRKQSEKMKG